MTRNGKIARLSRAVREDLNQRLDDGVPGKQLVAWLNGRTEVQAVLARDFEGKAITEQNLSEWKQGGFLDWQRHQVALEGVRVAREEALELQEEAGPEPLSDVLGASVTLLLSRLIRELGEGGEPGPEQRQELLAMIREWTALRKADHKAARLKMQREDWTAAKEKAAASEARATEEARKTEAEANTEQARMAAFERGCDQIEDEVVGERYQMLCRERRLARLCRFLAPEGAKKLRAEIETEIEQRQLMLAVEASHEPTTDPTESDLIQPNPTDGNDNDGST